MEYYKETWKLEATPEKKLDVLIVGAGIAGLATAIGEFLFSLPTLSDLLTIYITRASTVGTQSPRSGAGPGDCRSGSRDPDGTQQYAYPRPIRCPSRDCQVLQFHEE